MIHDQGRYKRNAQLADICLQNCLAQVYSNATSPGHTIYEHPPKHQCSHSTRHRSIILSSRLMRWLRSIAVSRRILQHINELMAGPSLLPVACMQCTTLSTSCFCELSCFYCEVNPIKRQHSSSASSPMIRLSAGYVNYNWLDVSKTVQVQTVHTVELTMLGGWSQGGGAHVKATLCLANFFLRIALLLA